MDFKKFIESQELSDHPIGLGGCRNMDYFFDSCDYDIMVFDENRSNREVISFENNLVTLHHASLSETNTKKLLQYDNLKILQDASWNLKIFLSKISEKRNSLFSDFAKNSLIESIFCCQKTKDGSTYLAINTHQPLDGPVSWYEAHLCSEEGTNILGALFAGTPSILIGANENLAWAHTVNQPDKTDVFALEMHPKEKLKYKMVNMWIKLAMVVGLFSPVYWKLLLYYA